MRHVAFRIHYNNVNNDPSLIFVGWLGHFAFQIHYDGNDDSALMIFVGWMYETGVVLALDVQRVRLRLYCCVCVAQICYLLVFDTVGPMRPHHVILASCNSAFQIHYTPGTINVNNGRASIFVGWIYDAMAAVLTLDEQRVRLYCWVWVIEFDVCY